ncbi:MAG TPA: metalloregulator ArsR/SmtB family transcription factor [Kiritimatiellia bacterium]|nr:metalloregulator ArsR/SmtB family transcription factor [Kiritimatiellia bacterium]HRU71629.1 metalloregulator ArsR/SmtB family transcription factor [Kiritimatiellia bacterium]
MKKPRIDKFVRKEWEMPARKFKALGHPLRLWIAQQLLEGERCVHELVEQTELDFSTVSQHLTALKAADVLTAEKRGKEIYYSLKCDCVRRFLACLQSPAGRRPADSPSEQGGRQ